MHMVKGHTHCSVQKPDIFVVFAQVTFSGHLSFVNSKDQSQNKFNCYICFSVSLETQTLAQRRTVQNAG